VDESRSIRVASALLSVLAAGFVAGVIIYMQVRTGAMARDLALHRTYIAQRDLQLAGQLKAHQRDVEALNAQIKTDLEEHRAYIAQRDEEWGKELNRAAENVDLVRAEHRAQLAILEALRAKIEGKP
jgi:type II secretory pathway component PulJ